MPKVWALKTSDLGRINWSSEGARGDHHIRFSERQLSMKVESGTDSRPL